MPAWKMIRATVAFLTVCLASAQIEYNILEELDTNTLIGNIQTDAEMAEKYARSVLSVLRYSFLTQPKGDEALFAIEETTGILRTAMRIDRDRLCPGLDLCTLSLDIAVGPGQYFQVIPIRIEVLDVNDNAPTFSETEVSESLSEASVAGSTFVALPIPEDVDSPANGLHRFEVIPDTSPFAIRQQRSLDGTVDLQLVLTEDLDREETDFYQLKVVAYDGGSPPRSGSVTVNITVEDANDNAPVFTKVDYLAQIPENLLPEATIITVAAHDADAKQNAEVSYALSSRTQSVYGELFGIKADTGDIFLKKIVDAEKVQVYNLVVTATDGGPNSKSSQARVTVSVQDMNDNRPKINVNTLTPDRCGHISEVSTIGTFVAHLSVLDEDSNDNGNVSCSLNDTNFDIQTIQDDQYKIVTNNMFDREERENYIVQIMCKDHGSPSLTAIHDLCVNVLDVNDQIPVFNQTIYTGMVYENNIMDEYVLQVNATDSDVGTNAEIRYSLEQPKPGYFRIIPETGVIQAVMSLDYETIQKVELKVVATDRGQPPNTATASVIINIGDRNDEAPAFIQDLYSFGVYENQNPGTEVGVVNAYDPDSEQFSEIEFQIQADDRYVSSAFRIDEETGKIVTKLQLDRESIAIYSLRVLAYNPGFDLTGTATVTIYVADENDHAPVVDFPNAINDTVTISNRVPFGYVVTRIRAHDKDIGKNAQLVYALIQGNEEAFFDMDTMTGAITISGDLSQVMNHTYNLSVEVMDNGDKPQTAIALIHIAVDGTLPYFNYGSDEYESSPDSGSNSMIVVIVGCISGAVIVALIVAILAIRLQDVRRKEDHRYNCRMEAQKMLNGGSGEQNQSPVHNKSVPSNSLYHPSSKYSIAGSDILATPTLNDGSPQSGSAPENNSSALSFLEIGSLKNARHAEGRDLKHPWTAKMDSCLQREPSVVKSPLTCSAEVTQTTVRRNICDMTYKRKGVHLIKLPVERRRAPSRPSPKCSSSESTIQGPCQASHGYNSSTRSPQAFSSFSLMHSEIGPSSGYGGGDACCQGNQHAGHPHGFPAHAAAINKSHLSPLAENIQLQAVPWSERPLSLEHDSESACSGEMSNTDSGRGPSEEGEQGQHQPNGQQGNRISDNNESDNQERINKIGCHGNTGSTSERKLRNPTDPRPPRTPDNTLGKIVNKTPSSVPQTRTGPTANSNNGGGGHSSKVSTPNKSNTRGHQTTPVSLPGWENVPIGGGRQKPPRPPRTDSLNRHFHQSLRSNNGSQYASTTDIGDECSSSTSGSYIVDHEALRGNGFADRSGNICSVTMGSSDV
ncbi:hypothetical protein LSH36_7g18000 [Paralvinella palmiformis]|uniref:Cadherin domain-containing protein n=1 Tax=Paralvinella palmiformis TaxID=53620 RepID=A0AAD9NGU4_9ANNE|nr:hypothetical protein LSH36_7g18000 [Paralvinella palmiformis]